MYGDLRREAVRQRVPGAASAKMLPQPARRSERRPGTNTIKHFLSELMSSRNSMQHFEALNELTPSR